MRSRLAPLALLAALVLVFLADTLTGTHVLALRDTLFDAIPWRRFATDALLAGDIPLWNPYSRFGQPFVANPQSAVFYPPHWLFAVLSPGLFVSWNVALHLIAAACGTFVLGRRLEMGAAGALVAAVTYAFSAYMTVNLEFMSVMETLAWAPWTLAVLLRLADAAPTTTRRLRDVALLAVFVSLQILPGNPQPLLYTLLLGGAMLAARAIGESRVAATARAVPWIAAGGALAVVICAIQLLPTWELIPLSVRAGGTDAGLDIASMHPRHLVSAFAPFVDGRPGAPVNEAGVTDAGVFEFWLGAFHVGTPALLLAVVPFLGVGSGRSPGWARAWLGSAVIVGFLLAFGRFAPVYPFLLDVVPGFDLLRWPAKALQLVATSLALLAGFGTDRVLSLAPLRGKTTLAAGVLVALVFGNLWWLAREIHGTFPSDVLDRVPAALAEFPGERHERAWIDPLLTASAYGVYGSREPEDYRRAVDELGGEVALPHGLHKSWGGDALHVAAATEITDVLDDQDVPMERVEHVADLASIRWAWTGEPPRWIARDRGDPRAFVARPGEAGELRPARALPPPEWDGGRVRIPGPIPGGATVVLTDTWYPGWTASVRGERVAVERVNGAFRKVRVPPGAAVDELVMTYEPASFANGWKVTVAGLLALGALLALSARGRARTE